MLGTPVEPSSLPHTLPMLLGAVGVEAERQVAYAYGAVIPGGKPRPAGLYLLRFCTVNAQLSSVALLAFAAGRGLPSGFAVPVGSPVIQVRNPAGMVVEYDGVKLATDSAGVYHTLVEMVEAGEWAWEGQGWDNGQLTASTGMLPLEIGPALKP